MDSILDTLRRQGKQRLAECIERGATKSVREYSRELNTYSPLRPLEPEMRRAFEKELERTGVPNKKAVVASIEKRRILQTAPHLVATENSRMLCINWLSSLGIPEEEYCVIAMYSGIPFSNSFRPGRINRRHGAINLFPSSMQDDLVFRSAIPEKLAEEIKGLPEELKNLLPVPKIGDSYTKWALESCGNIERKILGKENLVYLDINEVVSNYIEEVKGDRDHPMNKIEELRKAFPEEYLFHKDNGSCPGLLPTFLALAFLNHFKCLGSFRQVEYLPQYQEKLSSLDFLKDYQTERVPAANLTTGEFADRPYPVDIILGEKFAPKPEMPFGELITNMMTKEWLEKHT